MKFRWLWVIWLGLFGTLEGVALLDRRDDTEPLTDVVRRWAAMTTSTGAKPKAWRFRRFLLVALLAWLGVHFLSNPGGDPDF